MAISKIILNGVTQMDVTQDTVTASTLMSGETAHDASGVQITGTAAGSNTFTLEYQNVNGVWSFTPTYADIKAAVQQNKVIDYTSFGDPALGGKYGNGYATNVTFNGTTFSEAVRFYLQDFTFGGVSVVYYGYSSGQLQIQSQLDYLEPQGTLNITTNGTHNVSSYASALVNVSGGGSSNVVTGTFTTSASGSGTASLQYTGNGYPVFCTVEVTGGINNPAVTDWYDAIHRYAVGWLCMTKREQEVAPDYSSFSSNNYGVTLTRYKSSTSSSTSYSYGSSNSAQSYYVVAEETSSGCVAFSNKNTMQYQVSGTSYGLMPSLSYTYTVIYSE